LKPPASLPKLFASISVAACCAFFITACERKPTEAEIEAARRAQEPPATPTPKPTPKPGEWMFEKNRNNPLEKPARR
jgi:hypothetical protein